MTSRLILANLDCESELARVPSRLPPRVRHRVAAVGTLLRVFACPSDRLWSIEPVAAERLLEALGLPRPKLVSGPFEQLEPASALLAWGETPSAARLRSGCRGATQSPRESPALGATPFAVSDPWTAPSPLAAVVARVSDRTFQLQIARRLGLAFDQATVVERTAPLEPLIRAASCERWVLKAPYSAAGRDRVLGHGSRLAPAARRQARGLLDRFGRLLFEPWVDRLVDFSCCAVVDGQSVEVLGLQEQEVRENGSFRGVVVWKRPLFLSAEELCAVKKAAREVGHALRTEGFVGPFGIDGWCYRGPHGERRLHALGEVNPRLTFGRVARALATRVWSANCGAGTAVRLRLGNAGELPPASSSCWPLLAPGPTDDTVAWVESIGPCKPC